MVYDVPFATRSAFETAMVQFVEAGFSHGPLVQLRWGDPLVQLPDKEAVSHGTGDSDLVLRCRRG